MTYPPIYCVSFFTAKQIIVIYAVRGKHYTLNRYSFTTEKYQFRDYLFSLLSEELNKKFLQPHFSS